MVEAHRSRVAANSRLTTSLYAHLSELWHRVSNNRGDEMRLAQRITAFRQDRKGATAVEFALIAGPFFFFLMALVEVAAVFFASTVIENAVLESAREIRTGQVQTVGMDADGFREAVCDRVEVIADCNRLEFDVRVFEDFDDVSGPAPLNGDDEFDSDSMGFDPGDAGDIVMVRVFYRWPLLMPNFFGTMSNMTGNERLITSATVFRNEPWD